MRKITTLIGCLLFASTAFAQQEEIELTPVEKLQQQTQAIEDMVKTLQKFKVSGYIQTQWQTAEKEGSLKVGTGNTDPEKSFDRMGIRRGRIKFAYEDGLASGVFQLDITEKSVGFKDAYLNMKDPWVRTNSIRAGIFDRPFGYEISYSSSRRESPERSTVFQTLFPDERDLGAMLILQPAKTSPWNIFKLEAGLFAGNGIKQETDNRRDFIGHLSMAKTIGSEAKLGAGISYYNGGVYQGTSKVYEMNGSKFELSDKPENIGEFAKRQYIGFDAQYHVSTGFGMTQIRGEYLMGSQPGAKSNSKSPNASALPTGDTYIRDFAGGYVMLVQDLGTLPLSAVVKYDFYDPNTKVSDDEVGQNGTDKGDVSVNTLGLGMLWRASSSIRLQAYYEINGNEKTANLAGFDKDRKDNVFTLRLQYKF